MADIKTLAKKIQVNCLQTTYTEIVGKNALVKNLFDYLFKGTEIHYDLFVLCTEKGLVLSCHSPYINTVLDGYTIPLDYLSDNPDTVTFHDRISGFLLITAASKINAQTISNLQTNLKILLSIYESNMSREKYLIECLDSVENAICIYDKEARFLYGNKAHCKNLHIKDRNAAIGMHILDITRQYGIKIHATKNNSDNLKMLDVLQSGKKILDWEVMIESETSTNKAQFISNNMYPIKNKAGQVEGMVEVAYSHQLSLNKTKKIMGLTAEYTFDSIIGTSPAITEKIAQAKEYANNPYNLLIVGESGVGKELFAQSIHNYSDRRNEAFVALNCASFPENLIESELFGYVEGAFTGASKNGQIGKFELADGGTLFLDEIGELPFHFQSKLLRVLETRKITRIGSTSETPVNVRVIAATNRDLGKMIDEGLFREDLYYRLQVLNIEIPPLRDRREDLLLLTESFFKQIAETANAEPKYLDSDAKKCLQEYNWPGNVRELRNVIHRVSILSKEQAVSRDVLEAAVYSSGYRLKQSAEVQPSATEDVTNLSDTDVTPADNLELCRQNVDKAYIKLMNEALSMSGGNKSKAAELLGVSRKTFYRMIDKYNIKNN